MDIVKLDLATLTDSVFEQMVDIEANCGIFSYPPEVLRETIRFDDTYAWMDGTTVAGFISMQTCTDYFESSLHIVNLNVAAPYRRRGLAQEMIRTVCGYYAKSHAGQMVTLDVEKTNTPARSLYVKLGFIVSDMPSENGPTDLVMTVPLNHLIS